MVEIPRIGEIRNIVSRRVEVNIIVVIAVEKSRLIKSSAHREESSEPVGMTQSDVDRVIAPEAAPETDEMGIVVLQPDQGQHFFHQIALILYMAGDPPAWMNIAVVPAL